jgi:hypothetical protein
MMNKTKKKMMTTNTIVGGIASFGLGGTGVFLPWSMGGDLVYGLIITNFFVLC